MRLSISKSIFSLLLILPWCALAQSKDSKKLPEIEVDTLRNKFIPTGLRLGVDLISPLRTSLGKKFEGWEVNADVDFHRYYLAVDYGRWRAIQPLKNGQYDNFGKYFRFGVDVNFLKKDPDHNMFFLGFRVGITAFGDSVGYTYTDPFYKNVTVTGQDQNLVGQWGELTNGLRVKVWKFVWMGYTARMKFSPSIKGESAVTAFDLPGYGLASRKLYWGFNYQVFVRIPWLKKNPPIIEKK